MTVGGWHQAIDAQLGMKRWGSTDAALRYWDWDGNIDPDTPKEARRFIVENLAADFLAACDGPAYYFEPEMVDVFQAAGESLRSWTLRPYDFDYPAAPSGVALFAKPIAVCRGIAWGSRPGTNLAMYWLLFDERTDVDLSGITTQPPPLLPQLAGYMVFDEETSFGAGTVKGLLATFLAMVRQKIVVTRQEGLPRAFARRATRAKLEPMVSVVTLRRPVTHRSDDEEEHDPVDWSHRWLVGAHWRAQWYPSEQRNRPIWIAPYIKGPEDKPLVLKRRAFVVKR